MNCFNWLESAKIYAGRILKEYNILLEIDKQERCDKESFNKHFNDLKELIELENMFYGLMHESELIFIFDWILKDYNLDSYTLIDPMISEYESEDLIMFRIGMKTLRAKLEKISPNTVSWCQIGLIELLPVDNNIDGSKNCQLSSLAWGCFSSCFLYLINNNSNYDKESLMNVYYSMSFTNIELERYFLSTKFKLDDQKISNSSKMISNIYLSGKANYFNVSSDCFSSLLYDICDDINNLDTDDYDKDYLTSVCIDAITAIFMTVPYSLKTMYFEYIHGTLLDDSVREKLNEKLLPLLSDAKIELDKQLKLYNKY